MITPAGRARRGFSLLELLIALGIASLLATMATAGYAAIVTRANRQEVRLALWRLAAAQETHQLRHGRYAVRVETQSEGESADVLVASPLVGWRFSLEAVEASGWTLQASAVEPQRDRDCVRWQLDQTGTATAFDADGADRTAACWRR